MSGAEKRRGMAWTKMHEQDGPMKKEGGEPCFFRSAPFGDKSHRSHLGNLTTSPGVSGDERDEEQHDEYPEKDLGDAYRASSNAPESEDSCHDGDDEKDKSES